jgi:hypothetical protein
LEKSIRASDLVPGVNLYGMFSTIRSDLMGSKLVMLFWIDLGNFLYSQGFRISYGRCSSVKSFHLMTAYLGAEELTRVKMHEGGKELTLTFLRYGF